MRTSSIARIPLLLCLVCAFVSSGCDEKAQEFARRTADILQLRSAELARKIAAETRAYQTVAAVATESHRELVDLSLRNERNARAIALAADYDEGRKPASRWQADLTEYAQLDHRLNRELLAADIDAGSVFMQTVQALETEQAKIDALAKLLATLAAKPALADDILAITAFVDDTRDAFDTRLCEALAKDKTPAGQAAFKAKDCK